jgi:hypothetical protein
MSSTPLLGSTLLAGYLARHKLTRTAFSAACDVDRATLIHLLSHRAQRVSVQVAFAIEDATEGEVPARSFVPAHSRRANRAA